MCWELTTRWTHCGCERVDEQPCEKMTFDIGDCGRGVTTRCNDMGVRCRRCLGRVRSNEIALAEGARRHRDNLANLGTWREQFGRSYSHAPDEWDAPPLDDFAAAFRYGNGARSSSGRTRTGSSLGGALSQRSRSTVRPSSLVSATSARRGQSHQSQSGFTYGGGPSYDGGSGRRSSRNHYQDDSYYSGGRSHNQASRSQGSRSGQSHGSSYAPSSSHSHASRSNHTQSGYYYSDDYTSDNNGQGFYYSYGPRSGSSRHRRL